jgi:N-acyl-D-amino-acid deacylase
MFDVVVRNGVVIDGSGLPGYRADIGIQDDKIAFVGRIRERAVREIDAEGHVVTPGFIDGHTHLDAQVMWDPLGTSSCWHGVTTVVMGNCGFSLAPVVRGQEALAVRNLERAEDMNAATLEAGIDWSWQHFDEYLDAVDRRPKGINYAAYVGHSALRTWAMGERAFDGAATEVDLQAMTTELGRAMRAGAMGLSTSRGSHETSDDRPVASRLATWDELSRLLDTVAANGKGIFEIALGGTAHNDPERDAVLFGELRRLALDSGVPITFGVLGGAEPTDDMCWRKMQLIDEVCASGGRMFGQTHCREFGFILSFRTNLAFDLLAEWKDFRSQSLEKQEHDLRDPATREVLVKAAINGNYGQKTVSADPDPPEYDWIFVLDSTEGPHQSIAEIAAQRRCHPAEAMIDLALERGLDRFFLQVILNRNENEVLALLKNPRNVMTFSDSGAHVRQIMDSSIQTHLLAHWVRETGHLALEEAVRMLTFAPASAWGFHDRGLVREGMTADLNVFDPDRVGPLMPTLVSDFPAGQSRLVQKAQGFAATLVAGQVLLEGGQHTGALPGRLVRAG